MGKDYTVEMVAHEFGITPRTLHYYEEVGLLPQVGRTEGGHRMYDEGAVARIRQILQLKETLGYSLKEIKRILEVEGSLDQLRDTFKHGNLGREAELAVLERYMELLSELAGHIDEKVDKLNSIKSSVRERLEKTRDLYNETRTKQD
ncbi:MerR family transcriptional regulator [Alicyclobacillus sp. SO9]|uniref:MerR family transcriptional regulator n=1 Tax=Alicyclobacillus sp. SO9 TaxID=2665646 RepID=UPI0018E8F244|nr:MerR family transcriptional regulator [Alicyclobacillus sp. SO9]QQE77522.1 MerR family transcriptional regulator [Alicyclobacillus sp. SO9]